VTAEHVVADVVGHLVTVVEACGAIIITVGAVWAFVRLMTTVVRSRRMAAIVPVRLGLGRALTMGLEFQLAADVLRTAVAPSFHDIGELAAIAAIRTALNYILSREIAEERREVADDRATARAGAGSSAVPPRP
jgi:uncharacterized membrane protein